MKLFSFIAFCLLSLLSCSVTKVTHTDELKIWDKSSPLVWGDFKGRCEWQGGYDAITQWGMLTKKIDSTTWGVYAYFYKQKSCHILGGDELLKHEQYHFNIAEVFVRRLRKEAMDKHIAIGTSAFFVLLNKKMEECREMQVDYDRRTNHSKLKKSQLEWQEYIDKELMALVSFSG